MTRSLTKMLRRFRRDEDGYATIEFAYYTPLFLAFIIATIDLGIVSMRAVLLERAVDLTVRELRLGNPAINSHADIKAAICDVSINLPNCNELLALEMIKLDMQNWTDPTTGQYCVDTTELLRTGTPSEGTIEWGGGHEALLIRACYKFRPVTPAGWMTAKLATDENGFSALVAASAFVNEPNS